jgi:ornithine cyclodeaminase/alanine dehydrogenase-like protein (mu-crystallin family)
MQLLLLSDLKTAAFLALVNCNQLSALRYGAMVALTIDALRSSSATRLALVGAGNLAGAAVQAIQAACPFHTIRVASRSGASSVRFCENMSAVGVADIEPCSSTEDACRGADVILTITNAEAILVRADWCEPGALLVSTGGRRECEPESILGADKVFIDDWDQCAVLGDIAALHGEGKFDREDITATLAEVITGRHPGRESDHERIVAVPQGLTSLDVALAHFIYRSAVERNLGTHVEWP